MNTHPVFTGTGTHVPQTGLTSAELDRRYGKPDGWFEKRTGVRNRPVAGATDQIEMAVAAARQALDQAGTGAIDIDLVIFAAAVPYQTIPATAPLLMQRLGIPSGRAMAFDVNATCLGFLTASEVCASLLEAGRYRRALIICSEIASRALPWETDPVTAALFGDGAAAAVLETREADRHPCPSMTFHFETYPEAYDICRLGAGGTRYDPATDPSGFAANRLFEMDGKALFRFTSRHFEDFLERLLNKAGWTRDMVDLVIPHQASPSALAHLANRCGFKYARVIDITATRGNQIAASIPAAFHEAWSEGLVEAGRNVLFLGTSAGMSFGGLAYGASAR